VTIVAETGVAGGTIWLGGRFRLDERVTAAGGRSAFSVWKATDELLCRAVTIHLLPRAGRVPARVVAAVQAAARVSDPRLATIYDTDYDIEGLYIVSEWTPGTQLEDLVLSGLPSPALAAAMIADAADALAVAHRAGLPHLCLSPRSLRWDTSSGLKITGLGIDAALMGSVAGTGGISAAAVDTMALARMLYALLTGCWPGDESTALPAAPRHKGHVYTPRQVRAGVPGVLDAITCRALQLQAPGLLTPAELAVALRSVLRPSYSASPYSSAGRHRTTLLRPAA
jgi:serine/threonine protein kinase